MSKKIEIIGNFFVMTDTVSLNEDINTPAGILTFTSSSTAVFLFEIRDTNIPVGEEDGYTLSELVDSNGNPFGSIAAVKTWLRSNTGSSGQSSAAVDGGEVLINSSFIEFPLTGLEGLIYIAEDTGNIYIWNGSEYSEVGGGTIAASTVKTLYESNSDTEVFNTSSKTKVDLITVTDPIDLDSVVEEGEGTITSPSAGNGNSGNAPGHTMTASIKGLWFMIDDDNSGLEVDMLNGDLVNNYPAPGVYNLKIAFRGYEHTSTTQTFVLTIT